MEEPKNNPYNQEKKRKNMAIKIGGGGAIAGVVLLATATFLVSAFAIKIRRKRRSNNDNKDEVSKGLSFLLPDSSYHQSSDATTDMDVTQILSLDEKPKLKTKDNSTLFDDPVIKREEISPPFLENPSCLKVKKNEPLEEIEVLTDVHEAIEAAYVDQITVEKIPQSPILNFKEKEECNVGGDIIVEKCDEVEMQLNEEQESPMGVGDEEIICFDNSKLERSSSAFEATDEAIEAAHGEEIIFEEDPQVQLTQEEQKEEEFDEHIIVEKCEEDDKQQIQTSEGQETLVNDDQEFSVSSELKPEMGSFEKHDVKTMNDVIELFCVDEIAVEDDQPIQPKKQKEECDGEIIVEKCEEEEQIQPSEEQETLLNVDKAIEPIFVDEIALEEISPIQPKEQKEECDGESIVEICEEEEQIQPSEEQETLMNVDKAIELICVDEIAVEEISPIQPKEQKEECDGEIIVEKCEEDEQIQLSGEQETLMNVDKAIEPICADEIAVEEISPIQPKEQKEKYDGEIIMEKCEDEQIQPSEEQETLMNVDKTIEPICADEITVEEISPIQPKEQKEECDAEIIMEKCEEDDEQIQQSEEQEALANYDQEVLVSGGLKSEMSLFEKYDVKIIKEDEAIELVCGDRNEVEDNPPIQLSEKEKKEDYGDREIEEEAVATTDNNNNPQMQLTEEENEDYDGKDIAEEAFVTIQEDMVALDNNPPMQTSEKEQKEDHDDRTIVEETVERLPVDMGVLDDKIQMQFSEDEDEEEEEEEDVVVEDDDDDDVIEIVEEGSEETGDSSMESNAEAIWPADSMQDLSLLELKELKKNEDRGMKTEELHLPNNIGNTIFNGKEHDSNEDHDDELTTSFRQRYMAKLGTQNDHSTNMWKMRLWMWSMLMPLWCLCYCYSGLPFLKVGFIVVLVLILFNFH